MAVSVLGSLTQTECHGQVKNQQKQCIAISLTRLPTAMLTPQGPRVAVVLGAAVWSNGRPSPTLARRAAHAIALYRAGKVDAILGCGGLGRHPPREAAMITRLCLEAGLPADAIHEEDRSTTTRENLALAHPILHALAPSQIVLVTDPYHMPRARLIASQLGIPVAPSPTNARLIGPRQWIRNLLREGAALAATLLRFR
jgi:uncharacterized SAM-binding protein YcdF (DUF218 family)